MVSTRSKGTAASAETGEKRSAPATKSGGASKKAKKEDGKLEVGEDGQVGLKEEPNGKGEEDITEDQTEDDQEEVKGEEKEEKEDSGDEEKASKPKAGEDMPRTREEMKEEEDKKAEKGEDEVDEKALEGVKDELEEPKHGKSHIVKDTRAMRLMLPQERLKVDIYTSYTVPRSTTETMWDQ